MASDFIFELYTEEIPSSYQNTAISFIEKEIITLFKESQIEFSSYQVSGSSRRLYLFFENLATKQKSWKEEIKGPPKKMCFDEKQKPTKYLLGFASKVRIQEDQVKFKAIGDMEYATALQTKGGERTIKLLERMLPAFFLKIPFKKTMKWRDQDIRYARPIIHYFCFFEGQNIFFKAHSKFWDEIPGSQTLNSDIISKKEINIDKAKDYFSALKSHSIEVYEKSRKEMISRDLLNRAAKENLTVDLDKALLEEVNFLVEKPRIIMAEFDKSFLGLPEIIITTEMKKHQRYFPLRDKKNNLVDQFLVVANTHNRDEKTIQNIKSGNQRVLASRLNDASFFFHEDRKRSLIEYSKKLKNVVYQKKLGSMFNKKERIKKIAESFLSYSNHEIDKSIDYKRACDLIKADITTSLVYEFDSLQGEIGSIYASLDNETKEVSVSIREHYLPRFHGDDMPSSPLGIMLSLADKFDNLICSFLLGKEPSSGNDPQGVRRQSIHILEIITQNAIRLSMNNFLLNIFSIYKDFFSTGAKTFKWKKEELRKRIWRFLQRRLSTVFEKQDFDKKLIRAGLYTEGDDIYILNQKLSALKELKNKEKFTNLILVFKRMSNIVDDFRKKEKLPSAKINEALFERDEERELFQFSQELDKYLTPKNSIETNLNFQNIFSFLVASKQIVDNFFDHVMVMHKNKKILYNRITLLQSIVQNITQLFNLEELK